MEEKIKEILQNEIRPALQMDGGDIEFLGMEDNKAKVRLKGMCSHCPSAHYTLKLGVEQKLKEKIPELEGIIQV